MREISFGLIPNRVDYFGSTVVRESGRTKYDSLHLPTSSLTQPRSDPSPGFGIKPGYSALRSTGPDLARLPALHRGRLPAYGIRQRAAERPARVSGPGRASASPLPSPRCLRGPVELLERRTGRILDAGVPGPRLGVPATRGARQAMIGPASLAGLRVE